MTLATVRRHRRDFPCPVCGGTEGERRGKGQRCHGFTDGIWCHCSRDELAGGLPLEDGGSNTYLHKLEGPCRCGVTHTEASPVYTALARPRSTARTTPAQRGEPDAVYDYGPFQVCRWGNGDDKRILQRRPDPARLGRYIWNLNGVELCLYRCDELRAADPATPVLVCEGEKAVEACRAHGFTATCSPMGAGKWRGSYAPALQGRRVVILPDNDDVGRRHAEQVAASIAGVAASVALLELPEAPAKGDAHDFFATGGTAEQFRALIDTAPRWPPAASPWVRWLDELEPLPPEERNTRIRVRVSDLGETPEAERQQLRELLRRRCGFPARDFDRLIQDGQRRRRGGSGGGHGRSTALSLPDGFERVEGSFTYALQCSAGRVYPIRYGELGAEPVWSWAIAVDDTVYDPEQPAGEQRRYHVSVLSAAATAEHAEPEAHWLASSELRDGSAAEHFAAAVGVDTRELRALFATVVKQLGLKATAGTAHELATATGWHLVGGAPVFVTAGACITAAGVTEAVRLALPPEVGDVTLPAPPALEQCRVAVQASLDLVNIGEARVLWPLLATVYLAPLTELLGGHRPDFVTWLYGDTGSLKTSVMQLVLSHFGSAPADPPRLNFESTRTAVEGELYRAKDICRGLDDFCPDANPELALEQRRIAAQIVRMVGNRAARLRSSRTLTTIRERPARGTVIATGEDVPRGRGARARLFLVRAVPPDRAALSVAQAQGASYAEAMAAFVQWIARSWERLQAELPDRFLELRAYAQGVTTHLRAPSQIAHLMLGVRLWLDFAREVGAINESEDAALWYAACGAMVDEAQAAAEELDAEEPVQLCLRFLRGALAEQRCHLTSLSGGEPDTPLSFGYRLLSGDEHPSDPAARYAPQGRPLGMVDDEWLYLEETAFYQALVEAARREGMAGFPVSARGLLDRLAQREYIRTAEQGGRLYRTLKVKRGFARDQRRIWLRRDIFADTTPDDPETPEPSSPYSSTPHDGEPVSPTPGPRDAPAAGALTGTCQACGAFVWRPIAVQGERWPCEACGGIVAATRPPASTEAEPVGAPDGAAKDAPAEEEAPAAAETPMRALADYRDAWQRRGAAIIRTGRRCSGCDGEDLVRLPTDGSFVCMRCIAPPEESAAAASEAADDEAEPDRERGATGPARHPRRLAVLGVDGVYLLAGERPQRVDLTPPATVGELLDAMARLDVRQLWIHAAALPALGLPASLPLGEDGRPREDVPHAFFAGAGAWDVGAPALRWWYRARSAGMSLQLAIPAYNAGRGNWLGCWMEPRTAGDLLGALNAFSHAIGMLPVAGPGRTGEALLRRQLARMKAGRDLTGITLPRPALEGRRESDMAWMRPLTAEERGRGWIHAFDRNAQYLSVMGGLTVGVGEPVYRDGAALDFDRKLPGYWHAVIEADLPPDLPDPFPCDPAGRWYMTPTLELAEQLGARIRLREAYVWPEHHRLLEPWYKVLRDARLSLSGPARDAVKAVYTQFVGHLESQLWDREGDALFRPDVRQSIVAQARVNFWRILRRCAEEGRPPALVYVDEALFIGDESEPLTAKPAAVKLGDDLASFKHSASAPLATLLPVWDGPRRSPVRVLELLKPGAGVE